jgi:hypothetical protein
MAQVQRWYLGYSYRGKPQDMIEKISREVQEQNLSKFLPIQELRSWRENEVKQKNESTKIHRDRLHQLSHWNAESI